MATSKRKTPRAGALTLGAYIRSQRLERGMSYRELAKKAELSSSALCRIEQGQNVPVIQEDPDALDRIWLVLGGDLNQILYLSRRCPTCSGSGTLRDWAD